MQLLERYPYMSQGLHIPFRWMLFATFEQKEVASSYFTCSELLIVSDPSALWSARILDHPEPPPGLK
jgi:hypothetical protein